MGRSAQTAARWALHGGIAGAAAYALYALIRPGGDALYGVVTRGVFNAALALAVVAIAARAVHDRRERAPWLLLAGALTLWTIGNTYFSVYVQDLDPIPIPSAADVLWLGFYSPAYLALVLIVRSRLSGLRRGMWLDGVIGACAVGAVCGATVVEPVLAAGLGGSAAQVATTLAYPLADLVLLGLTTLVLALNGWRLEPMWGLLALAFLVFAVADAVYLWQTAHGTYRAGGLVDLGWVAMALLIATAALQPTPERRPSTTDGQRALIVPCAFGLVALGLLVYGNLADTNAATLVLATLCSAAVIARLALTFMQSRRESLTDSLTGLPNRRRLIRDLREQAGRERAPGLLILDLNGFKAYNDRFGHPAGDALLIRLSHRLQAAVAGEGVAYRLGGDEFCALLAPGERSPEALVARCSAALAEQGEGFAIDAAHGFARLDRDGDATEALRLADQRMDAHKHRRRVPAERQTTDALVTMLAERLPELGDHARGVAELAVATGRRLGLGDDAIDEVELAARLHDVGKTAVPDEILNQRGPLGPDEWELIRRHPAAGERILRAAPALAGVARLVRSSHERIDGTGYPDRLAGDRIPLGARIIAVCNAFDAMIGDRPYASRRSPEEALAELRRCAGTQFDPAVVDVFAAVLAERAAAPV
jgi:diguanylate cyclase (GGDEF)-like protein